MNATDYYNALLEEIQVPMDDINGAKGKRDELAGKTNKILRNLGLRHVGYFPAGALASGTQIRPLNDVDLVVHADRESLPSEWEREPVKALEAICAQLGQMTDYGCEIRSHAVKVTFPDEDFTADVVFGVSRVPSGLFIPHCPDDEQHAWIETDPAAHAALVRKRNRDTAFRFARVVRILKALNERWALQADDGKKPVSSFHLTALAWWIATEITSLPAGITEVLEGASRMVLQPTKDPSGVGSDITANDPARASAMFAEAAEKTKLANASGESASGILDQVFGDQSVITAITKNQPLSFTPTGKLSLAGVAGAVSVPQTTSHGDPA